MSILLLFNYKKKKFAHTHITKSLFGEQGATKENHYR